MIVVEVGDQDMVHVVRVDALYQVELRKLGDGVDEGVDAPEQRAFLEKQGCDEVQGFLISGALPAPELVSFLARRPSDQVYPMPKAQR